MSSLERGGVFSHEVIESRPGILIARVTGRDVFSLLRHEPGGHRHQRIPPNERKGRVHTSTVTVAVMSVPTEAEVRIQDRDLEWSTCRGSGAGGQHRNVTDSAVMVKHLPTGLMVRCENERSQHQNKAMALALLRTRLQEQEQRSQDQQRSNTRKSMLGTGQRGDKTRTYRWTDGVVTDHTSDKKAPLERVVRGFLEDLF